MKYILDTNIIIYAIKGLYPNIQNHFFTTPSFLIQIPYIVISEIEYGARKSFDYDKTIKVYSEFLNTFSKIRMNEKSTKVYGVIRKSLESKGEIIGGNDLIIASIALSSNSTLVTHNIKEFSRVDGLKIEDWTE